MTFSDFNPEQIRKKLSNRERFIIRNSKFRRAGVLIIIYPNVNDSYSLVITKRTKKLTKHSGEPSFPGGGYEPQDKDIISTALRESEEEIGINVRNIEILGLLDDMCTISGYIITPVVGLAKSKINFIRNETEVEQIFIVPIDFFLDTQNFEESFSEIDGDQFPVYFYKYEDEYGVKHNIWGATAYIIAGYTRIIYNFNPSKLGLQRYTYERIEKMLNRGKKIDKIEWFKKIKQN